MKTYVRVLATVVAAATVAAPLTACSGGSGGGKTTITYFSWGSEKSMKPLIEGFEKANPDIKIENSTVAGGPNAYVQTLTTRIAGHQTPDVFHISTATRKDIMDNGYAKDLTNEPFMKGIDQSAKDFYSKDGKVYGMAPTAWIGVIVYNKDLLKKVGYDKPPTQLDKFEEMGKKLQAAGILPYMEDPGVLSGSFAPMLKGWQAKQGKKNADDLIWAGKSTFKKEWLPALTQWATMARTGTLPPKNVGVSQDQLKSQFMTGKLAMYRSGIWDRKDLKDSGINYGVAPFPGVKGGEAYIGGGPDSPYAINAKLKGKKLKAAEKFLSFINSPAGLKLLEQGAHLMPTSSKYQAHVPPQFQDVLNNYAKKGKYGWINWGGNGPAMSAQMVSQFQLLIQGKVTPEQVCDKLQDTWNSSQGK